MADQVIPVEGGHLAVSDVGQGPPIVLLHGFSFDRTMWNPQVASLSSRYRLIRYDLRGFGGSTRPSAPYSHAEDLAAVITALSLRSPLLIGLSLGANVALEFAARWPDVPRGLVLASPGLAGHIWSEERPPEAAARIAAESGVDAARAFWINHPIYASLKGNPNFPMLEEAVRRYDGWHWRNEDPRCAHSGTAAMLPSINVPALVLSGGADAADYRAIAERISRELPDARLERIAGAGHLTNLETSDRFNAAVIAFAATLDRKAERRMDATPEY